MKFFKNILIGFPIFFYSNIIFTVLFSLIYDNQYSLDGIIYFFILTALFTGPFTVFLIILFVTFLLLLIKMFDKNFFILKEVELFCKYKKDLIICFIVLGFILGLFRLNLLESLLGFLS
jgi:hypothetical protein